MFLTLAIDGCEWSSSHTGHFSPGERALQYPLDRRLGGLQSQSGHGGGKEKNSFPFQDKNLVVQPVG